jgi:hypothetical protein
MMRNQVSSRNLVSKNTSYFMTVPNNQYSKHNNDKHNNDKHYNYKDYL